VLTRQTATDSTRPSTVSFHRTSQSPCIINNSNTVVTVQFCEIPIIFLPVISSCSHHYIPFGKLSRYNLLVKKVIIFRSPENALNFCIREKLLAFRTEFCPRVIQSLKFFFLFQRHIFLYNLFPPVFRLFLNIAHLIGCIFPITFRVMQLSLFAFFDYLESFIFMVKVPLSPRHGASLCGGQRRRPADMVGRSEK
jgi:hypothetical protein